MKLVDKAAMWYLRRKASVNNDEWRMNEAFNRAFADWLKGGVAENYLGAIYSCSDTWGLYFAKARFRLYEQIAGGVQIVKDHEFTNLLKAPNSYQTWWEHKYKIAAHFGIFGNSYLYKMRSKGSKRVIGYQQLLPKLVKRVSVGGKPIGKYTFLDANGVENDIAPEDMIDFRYPDPRTEVVGMPIVGSVADQQKVDYLQMKYMTQFYKQGGFLGQTFSTKASLNDAMFNRMLERLQDEYTGVDNAYKVALFDNAMGPVKTAYSPKEIDMANQRKLTKDDIYEAWKVSRIHVGSGELANRASNDAAVYQFTSGVIDPILNYIDEVFSKDIRREYNAPDLFVMHDVLAPKDHEASRQLYESGLKNAYLTMNEVREEEGLNPMEGALTDKLLINGGGALYDAISGERIGLPEEQNPGSNAADNESKDQKTISQKNIKDEVKNLRWKQFERRYASAARRFNRKIDGYIDSQHRRIVEALKDNFVVGEIFNLDDEQVILYQLLEIEIYSIMLEGNKWGSRINDVNGLSLDEIKSRLVSAFEAISDNTSQFNETTLKHLTSEDAESYEESKKIVDKEYKDLKSSRKHAVVSTTVLGSFNAGLLETIRDAGFAQKYWLSERDDRVRQKLGGENHVHMDGQTVPIDTLFTVPSRTGNDLMMYPGDPFGSPENIINCRCTILGE